MRYYRRMLFFFLSISVVFALSVEGVFLFSNISTQRASYEESLVSTTRQFCENTDFSIATGIQCATVIKVSDAAARYLQKSGSIQYNRLLLFRYLQSVFGASPRRLNAMALSTFEDDYVMRTDGTGYTGTFLGRFNMTQADLDRILAGFHPGFISQKAFTTVTAPDGSMQYIMTLSEPTIYSTPLYIFVSYTEAQLFEQNLLEKGEGCALFYNDGLIAVVGDFTDDQFLAFDKGDAPSSLDIRRIDSTSDGFRYLFVAGPPQIYTLSFWMTVGLGLVLMACLILIAVTLVKRMYLPIRELLRLSGSEYESDEFAFLKQRMLTLYVDMDSMSHSLTQYDELVENALYSDLLNGNVPDGKFSDTVTRFLPGGEQGPFVAVLLRYNQASLSQPDLSQDMIYLLKQKIDLYLSPILENRAFARKVDLSFDTKALIVSCPDAATLAYEINEALLMAESEYKLDFTASIGPQVTRLTDLSRSYREARLNLETEHAAHRKVVTADTLSEKTEQDERRPNPSMTKKMLEFIDENYNRDISLSDLAVHLNLSKNYVSTLFKSAVGSNFKDYLNNARYGKACQLLQENPYRKIKDVAEQVGCSKDILARLFLRYSGALPSDYQQRLLKK